MATNEGRLTTRQRVRLANAISSQNMETIALGYLGFDDEGLKLLIDEHKGHAQRINRDILQKWCNKNSGNTQTKVSFMVNLWSRRKLGKLGFRIFLKRGR